MTILLIVINFAFFIYELTLGPAEVEHLFFNYAIVPAQYESLFKSGFFAFPIRYYLSFFTYMFLHGGFMHVISNMWALWIFGDNVEDDMGPIRFLVFYLFCGVISGVVHAFLHLNSHLPTIGASGALAGVMGAFFLLYPLSRITTLILLIFYPLFVKIPAFIFLGIWFLIQLFSGYLSYGQTAEAGGVAWWVHIVGFGAGMLTFWVFLKTKY
jgi:membrane associated rhomboid family serine protease